MRLWLGFLVFGTVTGVAAYLLYARGIMVTKMITAVFLVFRTGKNGDRASLNSCTGWVRHVGRFRASGLYTFTLDSHLSKGEAAVSLLDRDKRELLRLDRTSAGGTIALYRENRYDLQWKFQSATGICVLYWESNSAI